MKHTILLFLGFFFSFVLIIFSADGTFSFQKITPSISIINYAEKSNQLYLTSALIGYFFLLLFGCFSWKNYNRKNFSGLIILFSSLGLLFETITFYKAYFGIYQGNHFRVGIALSLIGLFILLKEEKIQTN